MRFKKPFYVRDRFEACEHGERKKQDKQDKYEQFNYICHDYHLYITNNDPLYSITKYMNTSNATKTKIADFSTKRIGSYISALFKRSFNFLKIMIPDNIAGTIKKNDIIYQHSGYIFFFLSCPYRAIFS